MAHPVNALSLTRLSLHRLAEHVLAAALYRETRRIDLRPAPGGITTPRFGADDRSIAVELGALVLRSRDGEQREWVTTLRAAGEFVGVEPGAPAEVYKPATSCRLDTPLTLETSAVQVLADWFMFGQIALKRISTLLADEGPSETILWPEHFDLGMTADGINYGFSPGDEFFNQPYAYVGPHELPQTGGGYWNAPFGAFRAMNDLTSVDDAVAFLLEGHERAAAASATRHPRRNA